MEENNILQIIGNNIKTARLQKGYTQERVAEELNTSDKFVSMMERGQSGLSITTIVNICLVLNIEPNTLFNGIINYNDDKDNYITNQLSSFSGEDKEFLISVIEYILGKSNR